MSGFGYSAAKPSITFSKDSQYLHKTLIQNETLSPHYMQDCSKSIVGLWPALAIPNFIKYFHFVWPSLTARFPSWVVLQIYSSLATWTVNGPLYWCFQNSLYDAQYSFVSVHNVLLQNSSPAIIPSPRPLVQWYCLQITPKIICAHPSSKVTMHDKNIWLRDLI